MASIQFDTDDDYDKKCGEMFLTLKGNIVFHCTLCDDKYETFEHYADHVLLHYIKSSNIKQAITNEVQPAQLNDDNRVLVPKWRKNKPPPISELMTKLFEFDTNATPPVAATIKEEAVDEEATELMLTEIQQQNDSLADSETLDIKVEFSETGFSDNESTTENTSVDQANLEQINYLYECSACNEVFATPTTLKEHKQEQHQTPSSTKLQKRQQATKSFSLETRHLHICERCGKGFPSTDEYTEHIEYYANENNKQCTFCEMLFESCNVLHRHMGIHYHERHYECFRCKARFKKERGLIEHKMKFHENGNNERMFACKMCDKKFQLKAGLKWHTRTIHLKRTDYIHGYSDLMEVDLGSHVNAMTSAALL